MQVNRLVEAAPALARLASEHHVVFVHGNGPQVGLLATESSNDRGLSTPYPLSDMVAESQGLIGLWLQQALVNAGLTTPVVTLISQTVVDPDDPAMLAPTKFIGPIFTAKLARQLSASRGWDMALDGTAWRRVVASPTPQRIVELPVAATLLDAGVTVILGGGGGVPVRMDGGGLHSLDAVVDKDGVASLIATHLDADVLAILTDVEGVMQDFGTPVQRLIREFDPRTLSAERFASGSMGPKVAAASAFVIATGGRATIGSLASASAVVTGDEGTQFTVSSRQSQPQIE